MITIILTILALILLVALMAPGVVFILGAVAVMRNKSQFDDDEGGAKR